MKPLFLFLLSCSAISCSNYFYKVDYSDKGRINRASTITLDDRYEYYIRKVYQRTSGTGEKILSTNLRIPSTRTGLIEIEYLLIGKNNDNAIYITMVQDKRQKFYSENYLGDAYLNGYDFRNFLFGRLKGDSIQFESKSDPGTRDLWTLGFRGNRDTVYVNNIFSFRKGEFYQSLPVDYALEKGIGFIRISQPALVYHDPDDELTENIFPSTDNKMHFLKWWKKMRIHFSFLQDRSPFLIYYKADRYPYRADIHYDRP